MLTSEPPPSYSEVTSSGYGSSSGVSGSHLLVVTAQEVDEVLRRHTPHLNLTTTQKDTVKRKTESLLKRNLREHGILPSSQQKQFILERVVLEFVPQSNNPRLTSSSGHDIPRGSSSNSARTPVMTQPAPSVVHVTTPPSGGHMDNQRQLVVIGKWWWNSNVYSHEVQRVVNGMMIIAILLCVIGTPLTLFFTIPTLYILRKAKKSADAGEFSKAKKYYKKFQCMYKCSGFSPFIVILLGVVAAVPILLVLYLYPWPNQTVL